ncbi:MAG: nitroreductase family protein [Clostridia bacterium]|nr:nitroreductase family protein [Clostridia bacterium]
MFRDLVVKNRSYRGFDESYRIDRETLLELVDLTRFTAASANLQPLKYFVASEKEIVDQIQPLTKWAGSLSHLNLPYPGTRPTAFIVICQDESISASVGMLKDVGIVAQTITLGAAEKGLGCCMIGSFELAALKKLLNLPETIEPKLVIALGKPAETIVLTDAEDGKTTYYRDEAGVHYVPKRKLEDILLG